ncbi:MAG TPA: hypothetical protein VMY42_07365 [Thermoguttaceae bacterium]|nr:hypothetical protein [Thermoguttaceae bacterium]
MSRLASMRILLLAVGVALLLPGLAQAKRFERYPDDVFTNMRGGINTTDATEYLGLFDLAITVDLDERGISPGGTFFMLSESFHGRGRRRRGRFAVRGGYVKTASQRTSDTESW